MGKNLTKKEAEFCCLAATLGNGAEAAYKAGFTVFPQKKAEKLLRKKQIADEIEKIKEKNAKNEEALTGLRRLAFGSVADAVNLAVNFGESVCTHRAGEFYGDTLCFKRLNGVTDAYEWSFVAVPAQRNAGVTKTAKDRKNTHSQIEKAKIQKDLGFAVQYRNEMKQRALKGFSLILPELSSATAENIINLCNAPALSELVSAFERKTAKTFPIKSQFSENSTDKTEMNSQFKF